MGTVDEWGSYFYKSSQPFPPASMTFRHYLDDYCRELTSTHNQHSDSNWEPLVSERKSLITKLLALKLNISVMIFVTVVLLVCLNLLIWHYIYVHSYLKRIFIYFILFFCFNFYLIIFLIAWSFICSFFVCQKSL